ncbi:ABC transporter substrate-binding protein [Microbacterium terricola]|uniref:Branched-chain amino acid ABC transporter substrate-binding protein n=1 Tax=Microbacterium terricola TaxID=344163 RepID=A0ABM8E3E8_9MICO|nr:ABC transporter substrate-binding protein [Microbacterium terricola]UYK40036.1 ABC transporter substrate-binding protein [Microbacterium terricola]BDV32270.1 branched-chain amino acid ABC transporter substrate-binding protein [Microbacterium terricola]
MKAITVRGALALTAAALLAASLAGCVADDTGSGNAGGTTDKGELQCGLANGEAASGDPIKVGAIATASGGVDFSSSPKAAAAYFDCVNENGGINGRPIDYSYEDDQFDPTKTAQLAAGFAADSDVVGLVGDATFIGCDVANAEYVKADLYSITGVGVPQSCFSSSNLAPVNAGPRQSAIQLLQWLEETDQADAVFQVGLNTQGNGDWVAAGINEYAEANGINIVGTELSDPAETNWLPLIQKIKDSGATSVIIVDPAPITAAILAAVEQQDARGDIIWTCTASCYDAQFGSQIGSYWEGFVANSELQLVDAAGEDNELWKSVMDAYAADDAPRDTFSQAGFLAAKMFTDALLELDPADISRETVSEAMLGITNYSSDLLCRPWYYGEAAEHNANHSTRTAEITDGVFTKLSECIDSGDPALESILANEESQGLVG